MPLAEELEEWKENHDWDVTHVVTGHPLLSQQESDMFLAHFLG